MTITAPTATKRVPMDSLRKSALVAGVIYLITFISIPPSPSTAQCGTIRTTSSGPARTPP
jgi:hypothetical protein